MTAHGVMPPPATPSTLLTPPVNRSFPVSPICASAVEARATHASASTPTIRIDVRMSPPRENGPCAHLAHKDYEGGAVSDSRSPSILSGKEGRVARKDGDVSSELRFP